MKLSNYGHGWLRIRVEDQDQYELRDYNAVDVDLDPTQVKRIVRWAMKNNPELQKEFRKKYGSKESIT